MKYCIKHENYSTPADVFIRFSLKIKMQSVPYQQLVSQVLHRCIYSPPVKITNMSTTNNDK